MKVDLETEQSLIANDLYACAIKAKHSIDILLGGKQLVRFQDRSRNMCNSLQMRRMKSCQWFIKVIKLQAITHSLWWP